MRKSKFATGSGRPRRAILGLDSLEGRVMPDGKIIASLSPTGVLTITGDDAPNGLTITVTATDVTIDPDASTFLNSKALGDSETFLGVVKTIKADFKGGNDSISISPTLPFVVPGAVSFLLGDGDNTLDLTTDKVITLGSLFTKGGDGLDTVTVQAGIGLSSKVIGPATFTYASGGSSTTLGDIDFGSTLSLTAGDVADSFNDLAATTVRVSKFVVANMGNSFPGIASFADCTLGALIVRGQSAEAVLNGGTTVNGLVSVTGLYQAVLSVDGAILNQSVVVRGAETSLVASGEGTTIGGSLVVVGSAFTDTSFLTDTLSEVKGSLIVKGGWYHDLFTANSQFKVAKSVSLILAGGNNNVTMGEAAAPLSIGGVFAIRTGDGRDTITLTRVSVVGAASIFTFGGNDLLQIETASSFTSTFLADMGTGNDTISIAQDPTGGVGEVFFSKSVTIKGNAGDDSLLLGLSNLAGGDLNSRVRFVAPINIVDGGLGTDTFNVANSQIVGAVTLVGWNP